MYVKQVIYICAHRLERINMVDKYMVHIHVTAEL